MNAEGIETYEDLLRILERMTPDQLSQPIQVVNFVPSDDMVNVCQPAVCIGSIGALGLRFVRSSVDNRKNVEEIVISIDHNPFSESGVVAYEWRPREDSEEFDEIPLYQTSHDAGSDWTGPAQALIRAAEANEGAT